MKEDKYYEKLEKDGYYSTIDKRSKDYREYKEWKSYQDFKHNVNTKSSVGLGDVVEKITKATGIKKVVESITDDCGCDERKKKFNKITLWKNKKVECLEPDDYIWLRDSIYGNKNIKYTLELRSRLLSIYSFVFKTKPIKDTTCVSCLNGYVNDLNKYLDIYDE